VTGAVARRLLAEVIGTGLLVAVVAGSGIAATRLTTDGALRLLVNSVVCPASSSMAVSCSGPDGTTVIPAAGFRWKRS